MEEQEKIKNMQEVKKAINNLNPELLKEDLIRDNKIEFDIDNINYRVRVPTNKERNIADKFKQKTYLELLQTPGYCTRSSLIQILKEKQNVDVFEIEDKIKILTEQIEGFYEKIASCMSEDTKGIESLIKKVNDRFTTIQELSIEKAELLAFCIEEEVYTRYLEYLVVVCTEKEVEPEETGKESEWKRVWKSQEEFDNDSNMMLAEKATLYLSQLFASIRRF